jgi:hypothetical protein
MNDDYQQYDAPCMRNEDVLPLPGELFICLREAISLEGWSPELKGVVSMDLPAGTILYADVNVRCMRAAIDTHLTGPAAGSEVRFGAGILLGLEAKLQEPEGMSQLDEQAVDDWLDCYTAFVFRTEGAQTAVLHEVAHIGLFNGIDSHWRTHWGIGDVGHSDSAET